MFYDQFVRFLYFHFSSYFFRRYLRGPKRGLSELFLYREEFSDLYLVVLTTFRAAGFMRRIICYVCPSKRFKRLHARMAYRMFGGGLFFLGGRGLPQMCQIRDEITLMMCN